jgi:ribosome-associated protein
VDAQARRRLARSPLGYIRSPVTRDVPIHGETIRLGQLLKLAGVVDSGSDVKALLAGEPALVNGEPDTRRGRQLHRGDVVRVGGEELRVV